SRPLSVNLETTVSFAISVPAGFSRSVGSARKAVAAHAAFVAESFAQSQLSVLRKRRRTHAFSMKQARR
ncbi:MAG TPA: hypothetical protein VGI70_15295, partial [Polyangiales bacterium]